MMSKFIGEIWNDDCQVPPGRGDPWGDYQLDNLQPTWNLPSSDTETRGKGLNKQAKGEA